MNIFGISDKGRHRAENQDSFRICQMENAVLAVVSDGMGGAAAGRLAGDMTVSKVVSFARAGLEAGGRTDEILRLSADAANRSVYQHASSNPDCEGMGATLVGAYFGERTAVFINIGDSRGYRVAKDGIVQITKDHSLVQKMVDAGQITPAQALHHPRRNIITRAVGSEAFIRSDIFTVPIRDDDCFLLCSDGLSNAVDEAEIHRLILAAENAETACKSLIETALQNNARDNITAIVYMVKKGDAQYGK